MLSIWQSGPQWPNKAQSNRSQYQSLLMPRHVFALLEYLSSEDLKALYDFPVVKWRQRSGNFPRLHSKSVAKLRTDPWTPNSKSGASTFRQFIQVSGLGFICSCNNESQSNWGDHHWERISVSIQPLQEQMQFYQLQWHYPRCRFKEHLPCCQKNQHMQAWAGESAHISHQEFKGFRVISF